MEENNNYKREQLLVKLNEFCANHPLAVDKMYDLEDDIIELRDPKLSLWFISRLNGCKVDKHFDIIINFGNVDDMIDVAKELDSTYLTLVSNAILGKNDVDSSLKLLKRYPDTLPSECVFLHLNFIASKTDINQNEILKELFPEEMEKVNIEMRRRKKQMKEENDFKEIKGLIREVSTQKH